MSDIKWIKLTTRMFENDKIDFIASLPEADSIIIIWVKLLIKSGKANNNGHVQVDENMQSEMLSIFKSLEMIEIIDEKNIRIIDFERWVSIDRSCVVSADNWRALRRFILERDDFTCQYCSDKEGPFEVDHVFPRSRGGLDTEENLVCACFKCNRSKKDKTPEEWKGRGMWANDTSG